MSDGKRYLLTGASSGIGEVLARQLAARSVDAGHIINKRRVAYVPGWPWSIIAPLLALLPPSFLGKYF